MSENAKQAQEMPEIRLTLTPDEVREENNEKLEELLRLLPKLMK